jgi:hypothetical protein
LLATCVATAYAQSPEPARQWEQFLRTADRLQREADKQLAAGQSEVWRHYLRNQIEISAFDEQALNEIASDFSQKIAPLEAQERALVAAFHKQYPPGILTGPPPQPPTQLKTIASQRRQMAMMELAQLQQRLAASSYKRVETWVTKKEKLQ